MVTNSVMAEAPPMSLMTVVDESVPTFESIESKYLCLICSNPLKSPVQTECGHRMCRLCAEKLFQESTMGRIPCPGNEDNCELISLTKIYPDFCAQREMQHLKVHCKNRKLGCKEVCMLKNIKIHMADCSFATVPCSHKDEGCTKTLTRKCFDKHIYEECIYIHTACKYCNQMFPKITLQDHIDKDCTSNIRPCLYNCGYNGAGKELNDHQQSCRCKPQSCIFRVNGCRFLGTSKELERHIIEGPQDHIKLISTHMEQNEETINELKAKIQDLQTQTEQVEQVNRTSEMVISKLKKSIDIQETKIRELQRLVASQAEKMNSLMTGNQSNLKAGDLKQHERDIVALKDARFNLEAQLRSIDKRLRERAGAGSGVPEDMRHKVMSYDRQIGIHDVRLAEMDMRFQCMETGSYDGFLIWKIQNYKQRKTEAVTGKTLSLYSQPFYTSRFGYKMCARAYLNGDGTGKNTHLSLFFIVMRGDYDSLLPWPFKQKVTLSLLDQTGGNRHTSDMFRPDASSTSFRKPISDMNVASGCPNFAQHSKTERPPFLINDTIFIRIVVDKSDLSLTN